MLIWFRMNIGRSRKNLCTQEFFMKLAGKQPRNVDFPTLNSYFFKQKFQLQKCFPRLSLFSTAETRMTVWDMNLRRPHVSERSSLLERVDNHSLLALSQLVSQKSEDPIIALYGHVQELLRLKFTIRWPGFFPTSLLIAIPPIPIINSCAGTLSHRPISCHTS